MSSFIASLEDNVVLLATVDERRHYPRAKNGLECAPDVRERHAKVGGPVSVDAHVDLRFALPIVRFQIGQAGDLLGFPNYDVSPFSQLIIVQAPKHNRERATALPQAPGTWSERERLYTWQLCQLSIPGHRDLVRRSVTL